MILRYLELIRFRGHEHERVAFEPTGIVHLSGRSGYGKSTLIIDALAYALFGAKATRAKQENLRNRHFPGEPMKVIAAFEFDDGGWLTIERGVNERGKPEAVAYEPDPDNEGQTRILEETPKKVQRLINKRLGGTTWMQFFAAFVCRQDEIRGLIELTGRERQQRFHAMTGIHEVRKALDLTDRDLSVARAQLAAQEQAVAGRTSETEAARLQAARDEAAAARARAEEAVSRLNTLKAALTDTQARLAPLEQQHEAAVLAQQLEAAVADKQAALAELDRQLQRQDEARALLDSEAETRQAHEQARAQVAELREEHARATQKRKLLERRAALTEQRSELRAARQQLKVRQLALVIAEGPADQAAEAADLRARVTALTADIQRAVAERDERAGELERLRDTGECPTCLRGLGAGHDHERVLDGIQRRIAALNDQINVSEQDLERLREALPEIERVEQQRRALDAKEAAVSEQMAALDDDLRELRDVREPDEIVADGKAAAEREQQLATKVAAVEAAKRDLDPEVRGRAEALRAEISRLSEQLAAAREAADGLDAGKLRELREQEATLRQRVTAGEGRVPEILLVAENAERAAARVAEEVDALSEDLRRLELLTRKRQQLMDLKLYLEAFQRQLVADIKPALEEMTSEMLQQISGGVHVAMRITSENYDMEVQTVDGIWMPAMELSGGEQARLAICVRLALTHLVSSRTGVPLQFLVLDEPLPAQDEENVEQIMELLAALRARYKQIFIISHVGNLVASEHVDYVLEFSRRRGAGRVQLFKT